MPEPASTFGAGIDSIYYIILWITGAIFVLVETALIVFIIRYRHREGRVAVHTHGSKKAEIVWTVIPFLLVLFIVYASNDIWLEVKRADQDGAAPADALPLRSSTPPTTSSSETSFTSLSEERFGLISDPKTSFTRFSCRTFG